MMFRTYDDQLATWLKGVPEHHGIRGSRVSRCVPDFSCCVPFLLVPWEVRRKFIEGSQRMRRKMTEQFCRRAIGARTPLAHQSNNVQDVIPGLRRFHSE